MRTVTSWPGSKTAAGGWARLGGVPLPLERAVALFVLSMGGGCTMAVVAEIDPSGLFELVREEVVAPSGPPAEPKDGREGSFA